MAIKRKRPTDFKPSAVKEFTDRVEPRKAFWNRYQKMVDEGSTIITFYGAGGVGKTSLLKKLEEEIKNRDALTNSECKYVKYDFSISTDLREVLKTFKFQLAAYGCSFPLFDAGNYYYSLKTGQDITPLKAKSMMEKIPWLNEFKKNLSMADKIAGKATPMLKTAKTFFDMTDEVLQAIPVTRAITTCFSIVDMLLVKYMESTQVLDDDHKEVRFQLNARFQEKNPVALHEYLPTLFAMDVADWIQATGNKLIVLFDNYESLISATSLATEEQLKRDLWLRGDEGLIFMIPDTLWTIAGRNKIRWNGELAEELEQHLIKALSPEDSNQFLLKAGIRDETLRGKLVKLTEGYPIFLDLCVDVYVEYKRRHDDEPSIAEFGQKRQDVVARIFRYLDADKDDAAKDMLEFLCVLSFWTDELAVDIGGKALHNFSRNTYKRVKNFSFIQEELIENEDISLTFYYFDKTIQSILVANCDKKLIDDVKIAVNEYYPEKIFADENIPYIQNIFYLDLFADLIARFATDSELLREEYSNTLSDYVNVMIYNALFDEAEKILNLFMSRIESFGDIDSVAYANFELDLGELKNAQGKYDEDYAITNSACEKFIHLLGKEHPDTLSAMDNLATTLNALGYYEDALNLQEDILPLYKKVFGEEHIDTIGIMNNLALTMSDLGHYNEALALQEKTLALSKKILGEENPVTLSAMNNLATTLSELRRYDEALRLTEKVLTLRKKIFGEEHPETLRAINNLGAVLSDLGYYDEALKMQEKALSLQKEIFGEEHPETLTFMSNLASALNDLEHYDKALELHEKVLALRKRILGEEHPDTLKSMNNLSDALSNLELYDKALALQEKTLALSKKILGEEHPYTLHIMNSLAGTLYNLNRHDEVLALMRKILALRKESLGEEHLDTLSAMNNLACTLAELGQYDEALALQREVLTLAYKNFDESSLFVIEFLKTLAEILYKSGEQKEALQTIERAAAAVQKNFGDEHPCTEEIFELRDKILNN
ncbi:MAG: tetratricopeptide repeat protein [Selenomonadaceae bacterium]|nr:tetratricopeptide repeat protein [Selenomonadaceae bacterium]